MTVADRSPILQAELERIGAERLDAQRAIDRTYRWELVRVLVECAGSSCAGCFLLMLAAHMTNERMAAIPWSAGFLVGWVGICISIIGAYTRGIQRGDW